MAFTPRSWQTILTQIVAQVNALIPSLSSTSQAAYWRVWAFIQAVSQNLMEQRFVILQNEIETVVSKAAPETVSWVQAQVLAFQYENIIQINSDFSISYPDPQLPLIVSNCAVVGNAGGLTIKVTTDSGPLSSPQQNALLGYLEAILGADISRTVISQAADLLNIEGTVYYDGQYSGSIVDNVTNAVNAYIESLGFNGTAKTSDIIDVIRTAAGVTDFVPENIYCSPTGGTPLSYLIQNFVISGAKEYPTISGQLEINPSNPLSTSLIFRIG